MTLPASVRGFNLKNHEELKKNSQLIEKWRRFSQGVWYDKTLILDGVPDVKLNKSPSPDALGSFELFLDEELAAQAELAQGGGRKVTKWKWS